MSAFSDYLENKLLEVTLRGDTYTGGDIYVALFEDNPTDAGTGTETTYDDYTRILAGSSAGSPDTGFDGPVSGGSTSNTRLIEFPAVGSGTAEVTVTHWALFTAATGGNMLYHAPLQNEKTLETADKISFPIGSLTVTLD